MLRRAVLELTGPVAIRYPKGGEGSFRGDTGPAASCVLRPGRDITLLGYGGMIDQLLDCAARLEADGIDAEIVKLNTITPIDMGPVLASVKKTGRLLCAEEAARAGSVGPAGGRCPAGAGRRPAGAGAGRSGRGDRAPWRGRPAPGAVRAGRGPFTSESAGGVRPWPDKMRLDLLLVERGLAESRQRAQAIIMSGQVYVREQKVDKAGAQVEADAPVEVRGQGLRYVSRGGLKPGEGHGDLLRPGPVRRGMRRHRGLHRRLYRLYAPKRGPQGIRRGCGLWPAGLEPASGSPGSLPGADQRPLSDPGAGARPPGLCQCGRLLYLPAAHPPRPGRSAEAGGAGGVPGEAPVRGRPGKGGQERGRPGTQIHLEVVERFLDNARRLDLL